MSTPTAAPPASGPVPHPQSGSRTSPVEYVRSLSPEDKQGVFLALLREALQLNGDRGLLPIDDEDGKPFGYYVPPKAAEELFKLHGPQLTEEEEREIDRRVKSLDPTIPLEQVIADLRSELAEGRLPPP